MKNAREGRKWKLPNEPKPAGKLTCELHYQISHILKGFVLS